MQGGLGEFVLPGDPHRGSSGRKLWKSKDGAGKLLAVASTCCGDSGSHTHHQGADRKELGRPRAGQRYTVSWLRGQEVAACQDRWGGWECSLGVSWEALVPSAPVLPVRLRAEDRLLPLVSKADKMT